MKLGNAMIAGMLANLALGQAARADLTVTWHSIDGGGVGSVAVGSCTVGTTIGQHDAFNPITTGSYQLAGGYWTASEPGCPADFDGSGFVDLDDFIAFVGAFEAGC